MKLNAINFVAVLYQFLSEILGMEQGSGTILLVFCRCLGCIFEVLFATAWEMFYFCVGGCTVQF